MIFEPAGLCGIVMHNEMAVVIFYCDISAKLAANVLHGKWNTSI